MEDCIFCKIVSGQIPAEKVYEDNLLVAFKDIHPSSPVHILIIPKKHVSDLLKIEENDNYWTGSIQNLAKKLVIEFGIENGYQLILNGGRLQEVKHIHYHLKGGMK